MQSQVALQTLALCECQRHIDDLHNRGRQNNIRFKRFPEVRQNEDIHTKVQSIFNNILGLPGAMVITLERVHRVSRYIKNQSSPRVVICRVHDFELKEKIMHKSRDLREII